MAKSTIYHEEEEKDLYGAAVAEKGPEEIGQKGGLRYERGAVIVQFKGGSIGGFKLSEFSEIQWTSLQEAVHELFLFGGSAWQRSLVVPCESFLRLDGDMEEKIGDLRKEADNLRQELAGVRREKEQLERALGSAQGTANGLREQLSSLRGMFSPQKRLMTYSLLFIMLFGFSFLTDTFFGTPIVVPLWNDVGLFTAFGFLLTALALRENRG